MRRQPSVYEVGKKLSLLALECAIPLLGYGEADRGATEAQDARVKT